MTAAASGAAMPRPPAADDEPPAHFFGAATRVAMIRAVVAGPTYGSYASSTPQDMWDVIDVGRFDLHRAAPRLAHIIDCWCRVQPTQSAPAAAVASVAAAQGAATKGEGGSLSPSRPVLNQATVGVFFAVRIEIATGPQLMSQLVRYLQSASAFDATLRQLESCCRLPASSCKLVRGDSYTVNDVPVAQLDPKLFLRPDFARATLAAPHDSTAVAPEDHHQASDRQHRGAVEEEVEYTTAAAGRNDGYPHQGAASFRDRERRGNDPSAPGEEGNRGGYDEAASSRRDVSSHHRFEDLPPPTWRQSASPPEGDREASRHGRHDEDEFAQREAPVPTHQRAVASGSWEEERWASLMKRKGRDSGAIASPAQGAAPRRVDEAELTAPSASTDSSDREQRRSRRTHDHRRSNHADAQSPETSTIPVHREQRDRRLHRHRDTDLKTQAAPNSDTPVRDNIDGVVVAAAPSSTSSVTTSSFYEVVVERRASGSRSRRSRDAPSTSAPAQGGTRNTPARGTDSKGRVAADSAGRGQRGRTGATRGGSTDRKSTGSGSGSPVSAAARPAASTTEHRSRAGSGEVRTSRSPPSSQQSPSDSATRHRLPRGSSSPSSSRLRRASPPRGSPSTGSGTATALPPSGPDLRLKSSNECPGKGWRGAYEVVREDGSPPPKPPKHFTKSRPQAEPAAQQGDGA